VTAGDLCGGAGGAAVVYRDGGEVLLGGIVTVVERGQRQLHEQRAAVISIFLSGTGDVQPLERREARCSGVADGGRPAALPARQAARWTRVSAKTTSAPVLVDGGHWPGANV
jgi:hypothetical protein